MSQIPPGAKEVDLRAFCPPTAKSISLVVTVKPPTGRIAIYHGPDFDTGVEIPGPTWQGSVPVQPQRLYVQVLTPETEFDIRCAGWEDDLSR